jgi:hypothetical protein
MSCVRCSRDDDTAGTPLGGSSGEGGSVAPAAGTCSGKPGMKHGRSDEQVMAAGVKRTFIDYVPAGIEPNIPLPLVIVPHGSTMSGKQMRRSLLSRSSPGKPQLTGRRDLWHRAAP